MRTPGRCQNHFVARVASAAVRFSIAFAFSAFFSAHAARAQGYAPTPENRASRERFQNDKFGLFIHWGVYSVLQDGEWVMNDMRLRTTHYETLPMARFACFVRCVCS